jgi:hypothetical protein
MAAVSKGSLAAWAAATNLSIRALSHDPPLHRVRGLLSAEECRGLIEEGEQLGMERVGCNGADCLRTSSSLFLMLGSDPIVWPGVNTSDGTVAAVAANAPKQVRGKERRALVREVEERLARLMLSAPSLVGESRVVSRRQSEALQLQEYKAGEFYKMHVDSSDRNGYHRVATVIIYLTTVPTHLGGQTSFPLLSIGLAMPSTAASATRPRPTTDELPSGGRRPPKSVCVFPEPVWPYANTVALTPASAASTAGRTCP